MSQNGSRLALPGQMPQQIVQQLQVVAPLNPAQLIALIAAGLHDQPTASDKVRMAIEITRETDRQLAELRVQAVAKASESESTKEIED